MRFTTAIAALLLMFACGAFAANSPDLAQLPNARFPEANRIVSGAIDSKHVAGLREAGVRHVISVLTDAEQPQFDEAQSVTAQGMTYHSIPIAGPESLTRENAARLDAVLHQIGEEPALLHCSSGNRVGALIAVREAWIRGKSAEEAIAKGKRWGMTRLEPVVRGMLTP